MVIRVSLSYFWPSQFGAQASHSEKSGNRGDSLFGQYRNKDYLNAYPHSWIWLGSLLDAFLVLPEKMTL